MIDFVAYEHRMLPPQAGEHFGVLIVSGPQGQVEHPIPWPCSRLALERALRRCVRELEERR